jgi:hypothetical protein
LSEPLSILSKSNALKRARTNTISVRDDDSNLFDAQAYTCQIMHSGWWNNVEIIGNVHTFAPKNAPGFNLIYIDIANDG